MSTEKKTISEKVGIKNLEDSDELAFLTHYLQSQGEHSPLYKEEAWEALIKHPELKPPLLPQPATFPPNTEPMFKFVDLFAGIGGFRLALQSLGGKCVFSSEIDKYCKATYEANFGEIPFGDIKEFTNSFVEDETLDRLIPDHDILTGGFPCQAFSIAGKRGGFEDTRGTLFFDIARVLSVKKPKAFILENVKGLLNHRGGDTLATILNTLRNELGYFVPDPVVLNAKDFGVPQNRERVIIVGFRGDTEVSEFSYPTTYLQNSTFQTGQTFGDVKEEEEVSVRYYMSDTYLSTLREHRKRHEEKGNGFGYQIIEDDETTNAIVVGGMGKERNLVWDHRISDYTPVTNIKGKVNREGIRRMTPREWARLQGFPDEFRIDIVSNSQAYKQFGNSVAVPVIQAVGKEVLSRLK